MLCTATYLNSNKPLFFPIMHALSLIQEADRPRRKSFADSQSNLGSKAELQELDMQSGKGVFEQLLAQPSSQLQKLAKCEACGVKALLGQCY